MSSAKYFDIVTKLCKKYASSKTYMQCSKGIRPISASEGKVLLEFEVTEDLTNPMKTLHGGAIFTLMDIWTTSICILTPRGNINSVSISMKVDFMSSAKLGETVILDGRITRMGRTKTYVEAEMRKKCDNTILAKGVQVQEIIS